MEFFLFGGCRSTAYNFFPKSRCLWIDPPGHRLRPLDKPKCPVISPVNECIGMLAKIVEDRFTLTDRTPGNELDGINPARIVLQNTEKIFITGSGSLQGIQGVLCRMIAECKPESGMPVECNCI
jgi:hypothetical protein